MKVTLVFLGILTIALSSPLFKGIGGKKPNRSRYVFIADDKKKVHFVDLQEKHEIRAVDPATLVINLYSPTNPSTPDIFGITTIDGILASPNFNPALPTVFTIHGWNGDLTSGVNGLNKDAILAVTQANVLCVDWSIPASEFYTGAKDNVVPTGQYLGNWITGVISATGMNSLNVNCIGHSLGSHVCGALGANTQPKIGNIIGCDPAGPGYSIDVTDDRIDASDGTEVQCIHTNAGLLGFDGSICKSDFWPNGGGSQPGCGIDLVGTCAHGRSYEYCAESIRSNGFTSVACTSYDDWFNGLCPNGQVSRIGGWVLDSSAFGNFYLDTWDTPPYSLG